ncbi:hypothetical protein QBC47DRAFT_121729 [Echria macrotheca]|uniref:Uncharacterized protein n=1 Tax=Echria macrotheca TaxID=438768 RepID=A0AAJ0F1P1_9PEZI|nr:hypothetical protein QBC47DRAFT_121729 [Echria macrotheca]
MTHARLRHWASSENKRLARRQPLVTIGVSPALLPEFHSSIQESPTYNMSSRLAAIHTTSVTLPQFLRVESGPLTVLRLPLRAWKSSRSQAHARMHPSTIPHHRRDVHIAQERRRCPATTTQSRKSSRGCVCTIFCPPCWFFGRRMASSAIGRGVGCSEYHRPFWNSGRAFFDISIDPQELDGIDLMGSPPSPHRPTQKLQLPNRKTNESI